MSTVQDGEQHQEHPNFSPIEHTSTDTSSNSYNGHNNKEYSNDDTEPQAFTGGDLENNIEGGVPEGGDEMSRYESNAITQRTLSRRLTGADKILEEANNTDEPLPKMGGGRDYPDAMPDRSPYVVSFDGDDDPIHPHNWPTSKKVLYSGTVGLAALVLTLGSAMFAQGSADLMRIYHIGATTATLGTSLFVLGFASGPVFFGPLCELFGRKIIIVISGLGYVCFSFAVATAKDLQTIMICRFFSGFIGAAPLVVAPAVMADLFSTKDRGKAIAIFAVLIFGGPMLAPILGGFTTKNPHLGWRWNSYFCGIVGCVSLILNVVFLEETHHQLILVKKAETLRRRTGNWGIYAPHEEVTLSLKEIVEKNISRPIVMLFTEPILLLITIYNAFIYGMLYLFLTAIPLIFAGEYHFSPGVAELPYLSMLIGIMIGGVAMVFFEKRYGAAMDANGGKPVPEERLPPMMVGGVFFAIGLFWLGWTGNYPNKIHWIVPTISASFIGFGLILVFLPCLNYIIDCYLFFAASALAGNTLLRSAFGAVFPLFARQMFTALHIRYGATLLGCVAVALIPVPFLFYKYGKFFREKSKFAFTL